MLRFARRDLHVVRLKAGDPMVFGRAGEEIAALRAYGIPVEIVPGITAASALAATTGCSLTHRDHAHAVTFVTGHSGTLPIAGYDEQGCTPTLVVYMGASKAAAIQHELIERGYDLSTPIAVLAGATQPGQILWRTNLGRLDEISRLAGGTKPIIIGIGQTTATADLPISLAATA